MKLQELLKDVAVKNSTAAQDIEIKEVRYDSRAVQPGDLFVAIRGYATDGHKYIAKAMEQGAAAVVCEEAPEGVPAVVVENSRIALAEIAANRFGHPAESMVMLGVTGTNGKTTTTYLVKHMLEDAGHKVGLIGTNQNLIGDEVIETERTTPESYELHALFARMRDAGCTHVIMEVSSHSLVLDRVHGIPFAVGAFTNLTQDHLDFHKTMEEYRKAKALLFSISKKGVINLDDAAAEKMLADAKCPCMTFSCGKPEADLEATDLQLHADGVEFTAQYQGEKADVKLPIPGHFSVENALTALGIVLGVLAAAIGATICALWFRRRVSRPVEQITEVTRAIAGGRYGTELPVQRDDELGRLAIAINELSQEISRSEKMQSEFISSISHELRTPLTAITGWSETLMFDTAIQGDSRRGISIIAKEAARLTSLVEELLEFTRIQDGRFNLNMELLDIESELEDTIFTYQELLRQDGMQLIYHPPEEEIPLVPGDPERLKQVFLNILDNAAKYACDGKTIEVSVFSDTEAATIQFRDHGPGIPDSELPHVKEKFFKGEKHKARGSGIGLAVCDEIVTRSGGTLTIGNAPGGGTLVSVRLPFAVESST